MAETLLALTTAISSGAATAGTALSAIAPSASTLGLLGTGLGAVGSIYSGQQAQAGAGFKARQLKARGDEERAIGQRRAMQAQREKDLALSRVRAVSAASGGGVDDDSITNLMAGTEQQGNYNAMVELYQGNSARNKAYAGAAIRRQQGSSALAGSLLRAGAGAGSGLYSIYRKR